MYGFPEYDISEVINPAGEQKYEELLNELNDTRKLLLVYRLLHFKDKIPDIRLNIENREKRTVQTAYPCIPTYRRIKRTVTDPK